MIFAVILAGGTGSRMGSTDMPKQFLEIKGKPILNHTVEKFLPNPKFEKIIVLSPKAWLGHTREIIRKYTGKNDKIVVIEGGATRNETIMNAIRYIDGQYGLDDDTVIVTHDSVRPFLTHRIIEENIAAAQQYGACDTVIPATDTIVESLDHTAVTSVPDRAYLYQGQTPQSFRMLKFESLYKSLTEEEKQILTDAVKAFVIKGEQVVLVDGAASNIKITYPSDVEMAKAILGAEKGN